MLLVCGGAASGKSAYAESMLCRLSRDAPRIYLATMMPFGDGAASRIARHRAQRAGAGFETRECPCGLPDVSVPPDSAVLLEDIGNLCANELFDPAGCAEKLPLSGRCYERARLRRCGLCGRYPAVSARAG